MVDAAIVRMYGRKVGTFNWDDEYNVARFEYDAGLVNLGIEPSPIMMPVIPGRIYYFGGLNWDTFNGLRATRLNHFAILERDAWVPWSSNPQPARKQKQTGISK